MLLEHSVKNGDKYGGSVRGGNIREKPPPHGAPPHEEAAAEGGARPGRGASSRRLLNQVMSLITLFLFPHTPLPRRGDQ